MYVVILLVVTYDTIPTNYMYVHITTMYVGTYEVHVVLHVCSYCIAHPGQVSQPNRGAAQFMSRSKPGSSHFTSVMLQKGTNLMLIPSIKST